ncbi:hypothetical protein Hamer_G012629 [Homarus americanus]|uniref:Uncharacterized protein n=2 Tax=Homarus americanus TaxID=6706 RepID=A0A8J5JKR9_HOMAM|nr:hypothetical protein Hamer_G012629 [Homarus americanus]
MTRRASGTLATPSVPAQSPAERLREKRELESRYERRKRQLADSQSKALARQQETEEEAMDRRRKNAASAARAREHETKEEAVERRRKNAASKARAREQESEDDRAVRLAARAQRKAERRARLRWALLQHLESPNSSSVISTVHL